MNTPIRTHFTGTYHALARLPQGISYLLEGSKQKSTIAALDGVRAIACLIVVAFHLSLITTNDLKIWDATTAPPILAVLGFIGDTGVTLFFVLSGFLLFLPYAKALLFDTPWPLARFFYARRALRILPVYYLSLFIFIFFYNHQQYLQPQHFKELFAFLTLFMDSYPETYQQINGPFWTLAVEWQFYLLLPLLALLMGFLVRRGSFQRRFITLLLCLLTMFAWGIFSRYEGMYLLAYPKETFLLLPHRVINAILPYVFGTHGKYLEDFAIGMLVSTLYTVARAQLPTSPLNTYLRYLSPLLLGGGLLWLLTLGAWKIYEGDPQLWNITYQPLLNLYNYAGQACFAIGYGLCVTAILFGFSWIKRPFEWTPLRWIGLLSYGLYIWHLRLLEDFTEILPRAHFTVWNHAILYSSYWIWLFVVIIPCLFVLYLLVEKPFIQLGNGLRQQKSNSQKNTHTNT